MFCPNGNRRAFARPDGFTLIEMLAVITIIMVVMAPALPNFVAMMKERRWSECARTDPHALST